MKKTLSILIALVLVPISFESAIAAPRGGGGINAPSDLIATAVSSSQINLNWQDNSDNETGFKIERSLDGASFSEIAQVGANATNYSNTDLSKDTTYYYKVRAYKKSGSKTTYSAYSNTADATTFDVIPAAPTNLSATAYHATTTIYVVLYWQDNSDNEEGFSIERSTDGINFGEITTTSENVNYYTDYNVESGITYYYKVRAYNEIGYSAYSNTATATAW